MKLLNKIRPKSFRHTIVALAWASVSLPVLIFSIYLLRDGYRNTIDNHKRDLAHLSAQTSFEISQKIQHLMTDLDRIASDGSVIRSLSLPMLGPITVQKLEAFLSQNRFAENIMLIDEELFPVEVIPSSALKEDISLYADHMLELVNSQDAIRDPRPRLYVLRVGGEQVTKVILIRPVISAQNSLSTPFQITGLLLTTIDERRLADEIISNSGGRIEHLRIFSAEKAIFTSENLHEKNRNSIFYHRQEVPIGLNQDTLELELGQSLEGIMRKVLAKHRQEAIVGVFLLILMLSVNKLLADRLTQPLRTLGSVTSRLTRQTLGEYTNQTIDTSKIRYREFTELFELLADMESTIGQQFSQLQEINTNLERKVTDRTEELEKNLQLLDRQKDSLHNLVKYSIEIPKTENLDDEVRMTLSLAERICNQNIGIYMLRNENFPGAQNFSDLEPEYQDYLAQNHTRFNDYTNLLKLAKTSNWLQFFPIGSSTPSYQGFLVTERSEHSDHITETMQVYCSMITSALKQRNLTNELNRLAHMDSITGLANRHYFNTKFNEKINRFVVTNEDTHFGIFVIDVNGLKTINDTFGHHHGDEMLKIVAKTIEHESRANDTVARVGGDEFYVILEHAKYPICEDFISRLEKASKDLNMIVHNEIIPINFSIGFASTDRDALKNLLKLADERMYESKQAYYDKAEGESKG